MNDHQRHLFVCDCGTPEHQFIVSYFDDKFDPDDFTYVQIYLSPQPLWKRVKVAVQYILGRRSRYGAFEEILLNPEQCQRLSDILKTRGSQTNAR